MKKILIILLAISIWNYCLIVRNSKEIIIKEDLLNNELYESEPTLDLTEEEYIDFISIRYDKKVEFIECGEITKVHRHVGKEIVLVTVDITYMKDKCVYTDIELMKIIIDIHNELPNYEVVAVNFIEFDKSFKPDTPKEGNL